jgi:hypothetical protein
LAASNGATISGSVHTDSSALDDDSGSATVAGQSVKEPRISSFGPSDDIPGRFTGTARSATGESIDVKVLVDSQNRIFFIAEDASTVRGGFGSVTMTPPPVAISTNKGGNDDPPGDDHGQDDDWRTSTRI